MKILKLIPALVLVAGLSFVGCKPKDADVKTSVENNLKANADAANVMVMVNEGVATLSGEVQDEATKTAVEATTKDTKGVKSVVNNTTIAAPAFAPPVITADDPLMSAVADATKDHPTVTATVNDGVVTLTGTIEKSKLQSLMQTLNSLKPKKIDNQLTVK